MRETNTMTFPNAWDVLRWAALVFGVAVNLWALWVILPEIGKALFRFGELPAVSSASDFLEWIEYVFCLGWLPKDAVYIHLFRKLVFAVCNVAFLLVLLKFYAQGRRLMALAIGGLVFVTLFLIFSPAVGNL